MGNTAQKAIRGELMSLPVIRFDFEGHSNLRLVRFYPARSEMDVEFTGGGVYRYSGVTLDDFAEFCTVHHPGRWFHEHIRSRPTEHPSTNLSKEY